ncbi:MAG: RNA methyltransferase [Rhodobacteraceae bacterium]|nr:RNA methyltransferase [Paracoccaceae bacterium]
MEKIAFETPDPVIVLVRPQMGENIGAAARAMLNFGLQNMRLVAPRDGWPNPAAVAMASGAGRVLDTALVADDLAGAVGDCDYVLATTARLRGLTKPVLSPERAMEAARAMQGEGKRVAILFGPERAGLENEDVALANAIVTMPVNPSFASLNLAQSVLLMAYEWRRQSGNIAPEVLEMAKTERAQMHEVEKLAEHYEARLDEAGFFFPPEKAPGMKVTLRNMWSRMALTRADVQILHGMLRQLLRAKK